MTSDPSSHKRRTRRASAWKDRALEMIERLVGILAPPEPALVPIPIPVRDPRRPR
jgi:hypothetical protein